MTAGAIDTHAHLNQARLLKRIDEVLARAAAAGVTAMLVPGYDLSSSETAVTLTGRYTNLWAAVGLHPHDAQQWSDAFRERLVALAAFPRVVALGETGLDFYRNLSPREMQLEAFRQHLLLAHERGLPVICHCRDAEDTLLQILAAWPQVTRVWHCFGGTVEQARAALEQGVWLSFGGTITYPKAERARKVLTAVPLERMLIETDAPYLTPYPKEGKRPRDNEPAYLIAVAERIAEVKQQPLSAILSATTYNARQVFAMREA